MGTHESDYWFYGSVPVTSRLFLFLFVSKALAKEERSFCFRLNVTASVLWDGSSEPNRMSHAGENLWQEGKNFPKKQQQQVISPNFHLYGWSLSSASTTCWSLTHISPECFLLCMSYILTPSFFDSALLELSMPNGHYGNKILLQSFCEHGNQHVCQFDCMHDSTYCSLQAIKRRENNDAARKHFCCSFAFRFNPFNLFCFMGIIMTQTSQSQPCGLALPKENWILIRMESGSEDNGNQSNLHNLHWSLWSESTGNTEPWEHMGLETMAEDILKT